MTAVALHSATGAPASGGGHRKHIGRKLGREVGARAKKRSQTMLLEHHRDNNHPWPSPWDVSITGVTVLRPAWLPVDAFGFLDRVRSDHWVL